ncbi:MAG: ATP-dependent protease ATPase subunit HslU [Clostridia bacterium]|nr:ATP-dependent protease ATPase subunit HslU [Clostridia bacterium]
MMELTPKQIVQELDRYIIGQAEAKKAVAVALRNRYRRSKLPLAEQEEITPKNIILKGPTGVGKTEIARRLAKLVKAPFIKVEATKFTEVGYVGRDVESMIRDLVEAAVHMVKEERLKDVEYKATDIMETRIVNMLLPIYKQSAPDKADALIKEDILSELRAGRLDNVTVEMEVAFAPKIDMPAGAGMEISIGNIFDGMMPKRKKKRRVTVKEAREIIIQEESDKLIDADSVNSEAIKRAESQGIIFIDEIDKIAGAAKKGSGPDVSREGVQRDILPIVEGCNVQTKYGMIRTDYILFIAAGAFHISKVQDLIPELQGRFPVKVELDNLTKDDFVKILTQPDNAIIRQYASMLGVDMVDLKFTDEAIETIASIAEMENNTNENIGARRLHTVMEKVLEQLSFEACGEISQEVIIDKQYVESRVGNAMMSMNIKKYII